MRMPGRQTEGRQRAEDQGRRTIGLATRINLVYVLDAQRVRIKYVSSKALDGNSWTRNGKNGGSSSQTKEIE